MAGAFFFGVFFGVNRRDAAWLIGEYHRLSPPEAWLR
jgi:hypothetical protein